MAILVHITQENAVKAIRRNGIAPTRLWADGEIPSGYDRAVWAFPVLPSYTPLFLRSPHEGERR